jgi:hypothetical protein
MSKITFPNFRLPRLTQKAPERSIIFTMNQKAFDSLRARALATGEHESEICRRGLEHTLGLPRGSADPEKRDPSKP